MRATMWRLAGSCLALVRGRAYGGSLRGGAILLGAAIAAAGLALAGGTASVEATEYSAYEDPEKPVISVIFSEEQNVAEFKEEFDLSDGAIEEALDAVRAENEALARAYAHSEQIVEANEGHPADQVEREIAASDYDEKVRAAIAETKATIVALLPEERRPELKAWVDAKFVQEGKEVSEDSSAIYQAAARSVRCKVFATQYHGYTSFEVALPHRRLKIAYLNGKGAFRVRIRRGDHTVRAPVREVGPWNTYDNYWNRHRTYERMKRWENLRHLPRCIPWARAAYYGNYNRGRDEFGREVLNPAGVDLTPRVARRLGLDRYQNAWVYVRYPWVGR